MRVRAGDENAIMLSHGRGAGRRNRPRGRPGGLFASAVEHGGEAAAARAIGASPSVTTFEDHLADGGFGSWLAESVAGTETARRIQPIALSAEICDQVASQAALNRLGGLTL